VASAGKPVAAICHGPWTLVEGGVVRGRTLTSWPSLATDIRNAGGEWVDEQLHVDTNGPGPLITSRKPDDLPAFNEALLEAVASSAASTSAGGTRGSTSAAAV
jgi:protease I